MLRANYYTKKLLTKKLLTKKTNRTERGRIPVSDKKYPSFLQIFSDVIVCYLASDWIITVLSQKSTHVSKYHSIRLPFFKQGEKYYIETKNNGRKVTLSACYEDGKLTVAV